MRIMLASAALVGATSVFVPARFSGGALPANQALALGGGEVFVEATVTEEGGVTEAAVLRGTPPYTDPVREAVSGWTFTPARERLEYLSTISQQLVGAEIPVLSKVLVAAVFRPPTLNTPTYGALPADVAEPSSEIPFPITIVSPLYPPLAMFGDVVLAEVQVSTEGLVTQARIVRSAPPFDQPALDAAWQWTFRPARLHDAPTVSYAYIIFGFREPIT